MNQRAPDRLFPQA